MNPECEKCGVDYNEFVRLKGYKEATEEFMEWIQSLDTPVTINYQKILAKYKNILLRHDIKIESKLGNL